MAGNVATADVTVRAPEVASPGPNISIEEAKRQLQIQDRLLKEFPGVPEGTIDVIPVDLPRPRDRVSVLDDPHFREVQARLAIDSLRALVPVLRGSVPDESETRPPASTSSWTTLRSKAVIGSRS